MSKLFSIICAMALTLLAIGGWEKWRNAQRLKTIPIRINVNGIRGKSTATRLITAILAEAGYRTMGKTTGTSARKLFPFLPEKNQQEVAIQRRPEGATIKEQLRTIQEAASLEVQALVCECMAVKPNYQEVYQRQMFQGNVVVIVNVLEDHLEEMGPELNDIAITFARSIPIRGKLILIKDRYTPYFTKVAEERQTEVFLVELDDNWDTYMAQFDYVLFPDNIGIALATARALGIDDVTAYKGMLKAIPDPGALRVSELPVDGGTFTLVNGFAANEPASTLGIWEYIQTLQVDTHHPIILFNGRADRGERTAQFAADFFAKIPNATLVVMGQGLGAIDYFYRKGLYQNVTHYLNRENVKGEKIVAELLPLLEGRVLFTVGNIHGDGEVVLDELLKLGSPKGGSQDDDD